MVRVAVVAVPVVVEVPELDPGHQEGILAIHSPAQAMLVAEHAMAVVHQKLTAMPTPVVLLFHTSPAILRQQEVSHHSLYQSQLSHFSLVSGSIQCGRIPMDMDITGTPAVAT